MKKFSNFRENQLTINEMKFINGGAWDHTFICDCGDGGFIGSGSLQQFQSLASSSCGEGVPVNCTFDI